MTRIGVQLFTLRDVPRPLPELVRAVADAAVDGVEFVEWEHSLAGEDTGDVREAVEATGLAAAGVLLDLDLLEDDLEDLLAAYEPLGCRTYTVGYMPGEHFQSREAVDALADRLTAVGERMAERGLRLAYHHHDHEFVTLDDGTCAFDRLVESTSSSVAFELDVAWAAVAGRDPAAMLEAYAERVPLVHVKDADVAAGRPVELGEGDVDVGGCVDAALAADVEWLLYEYDHPDDPMRSLHHGADTIASLLE